MKTGILTFYDTTNYGAVLQMYALYSTVTAHNKEVSIVQYHCYAVEKREKLSLKNVKNIKGFVRYVLLAKSNKIKHATFQEFCKKHFTYSENQYSYDSLKELRDEYEQIIVGSDQIWNLNLTGGDFGFFLDNIQRIKKCSYAASFGVENLNDEYTERIGLALRDFEQISVRELSAVDLVNKYSTMPATFVLDPTFLLTANQWREIEIARDESNKKPYILLYLIQNKKKTIQYAKDLAAKYGYAIKYINISPYHVSGVENLRTVSPENFLYLIDHAELVITGSYHGLALSINFSTPVYYELNEKANNYNTRISSLVKVLGMDSCKLQYDSYEIVENNYECVQEKLNALRDESFKFLDSMYN